MGNLVEAIRNSIHLARETNFVSRNYTLGQASPFNRRDFAEFSIATFDGLCPQIEHHQNSSEALLKQAERLAQRLRYRPSK